MLTVLALFSLRSSLTGSVLDKAQVCHCGCQSASTCPWFSVLNRLIINGLCVLDKPQCGCHSVSTCPGN
jgi:hypothetical protein